MLDILADATFAHVDFFVYTELDQWMVRPMARLEPLFEAAGLAAAQEPGPKPVPADLVVMAVFDEYPCRGECSCATSTPPHAYACALKRKCPQ